MPCCCNSALHLLPGALPRGGQEPTVADGAPLSLQLFLQCAIARLGHPVSSSIYASQLQLQFAKWGCMFCAKFGCCNDAFLLRCCALHPSSPSLTSCCEQCALVAAMYFGLFCLLCISLNACTAWPFQLLLPPYDLYSLVILVAVVSPGAAPDAAPAAVAGAPAQGAQFWPLA